ncbi:10759_t:CDS:2, partial [Gigaspora rosea]
NNERRNTSPTQLTKKRKLMNSDVSKLSSSDNFGLLFDDVNGNLLRLNNGEYDSMISIEAKIIFVNLTLFTSLATVDNGYAILYARYSSDATDFMKPVGGLYVTFIAYNNSQAITFLLFPITKIDMKINAVHCDAYFGFCYYCIVSIIYNNTMNYEKIIFCSEKLMNSVQLFRTPKETDVHWSVLSSTPIGGYIFTAVDNASCFIQIYDVYDEISDDSKVNLTYFNTT